MHVHVHVSRYSTESAHDHRCIIGARRIIGRTPLLSAFDAIVQLPSLSAGAEGSLGAAVRRLLWLCGAAAEASEELALLSALVPPSMPLKQILHAVELSRLPSAEPPSTEPGTAEAEGAAEEGAKEAVGAAAEGVAMEGAAAAEGAARAAREAEEAEAAEETLSDALVTAALPYRSHRAVPI